MSPNKPLFYGYWVLAGLESRHWKNKNIEYIWENKRIYKSVTYTPVAIFHVLPYTELPYIELSVLLMSRIGINTPLTSQQTEVRNNIEFSTSTKLLCQNIHHLQSTVELLMKATLPFKDGDSMIFYTSKNVWYKSLVYNSSAVNNHLTRVSKLQLRKLTYKTVLVFKYTWHWL